MSMAYVRDTYGVPAKRGMWVEVFYLAGRRRWRIALRGHITSASNYIYVKSERGGRPVPCHPMYGVVYYDNGGNVLLDTRGEG